MQFVEDARYFDCAGERLLGILARPERPADTAVVILVGGPQYRVGSHRQFLLLSRALAAAGYPCLRFDFRGMGDSSGEAQGFEHVGDDIAAAIEALQAALPSIRKVVLWGLCDAASAALLYWQATQDPRLAGMVLLNPWVRSERTLAQTRVRHYYFNRLLDRVFWQKLIAGEIKVGRSLAEFIRQVTMALFQSGQGLTLPPPFRQRMDAALRNFPGCIQMILSENDYTAKEFMLWLESLPKRREFLAVERIRCDLLQGADHTFSRGEWQLAVEQLTIGCVERCGVGGQ